MTSSSPAADRAIHKRKVGALPYYNSVILCVFVCANAISIVEDLTSVAHATRSDMWETKLCLSLLKTMVIV